VDHPDLVLACIKDRNWHDIQFWATSLVRSGYPGKKVVLAENMDAETQSRLDLLGFQVHAFETPRDLRNLHFQTLRYIPAASYLRAHVQDHRFVFWTDVTDLVFQTDPSEWMEKNAPLTQPGLIGVKEGWLIKNQGINKVWVERMAKSGTIRDHVTGQEVLCSGTIQGTASAVLKMMEDMIALSRYDGMQGIDQGAYNVIWYVDGHSSMASSRGRIAEAEEGFVSTLGIFLSPSNPEHWTIQPPTLDRSSGLVYTPDGSKLYSIVHQYNRHHGHLDPDGDWRDILERRYL
jgi:hypothetical protein